MGMTRFEMVAESNRIEGIERPPTPAELTMFDEFLALPMVQVADLQTFVQVYQPNARLRNRVGLDVRVGNYYPPPGSPGIVDKLALLLVDVDMFRLTPWEAHLKYESLHPFTDGNGRSGRMLWYWMMHQSGNRLFNLGFLHAFYYQTLSACPRE